jgi:hypothetical protein
VVALLLDLHHGDVLLVGHAVVGLERRPEERVRPPRSSEEDAEQHVERAARVALPEEGAARAHEEDQRDDREYGDEDRYSHRSRSIGIPTGVILP